MGVVAKMRLLGGFITNRPLEGIRVIEFTHVISGPFCGMLLGDLGAEIVKIEKPREGEYSRVNGLKNANGVSMWFPSYNRNKKGITLNFKAAKAKEIVQRLVGQSDVLIENFRPALMEEMGFGYEELKKINPKIIMASISGFGQAGPYAGKTAFDMIVSAMGGFMSLNGPPGGLPMKAGPAISDFVSALYGALAIVAAIRHRDQTGEGQYIDVAMMDCIMSVLETAFADYKVVGRDSVRTGNRRPYTAPSNVFKAKDDFIYIAALTKNHWEGLCKLMGKDELINDQRFVTGAKRKQNEEVVEEFIKEWVGSLTVAEAMELLESYSIACSPVQKISELVDDPHVKARNLLVEFDYPGIGKFPVVAFPPKFSTINTAIRNRPPLLGEDNEAVICGILGYDKEEFKKMVAEDIL